RHRQRAVPEGRGGRGAAHPGSGSIRKGSHHALELLTIREPSNTCLNRRRPMAILRIAKMGNPVLQQVAAPVADPTAPELRQLAADMQETLEDIGASGLAAKQVFVAKRVVVYRIIAARIPEGSGLVPRPWTVMVNPVITPRSP